jgi:hypothetical protein
MRPASVTVIAILNLVFGGLWLLCGLANLGMQASGMQNMFMNMGNVNANPSNDPQVAKQIAKQQEIQKQAMEFSRKINSSPTQYATQLQNIVLSILLIVSGIGLLNMASWGRILSFVYAALSILSNLALVVMMLMVNVPLAQEFADKVSGQGPEVQLVATLVKAGVYVGIIVPIASMIYPAIVLILLVRPSVAAAFRGETSAAAAPGTMSEHIEEDERWGRG